MKMKHLKFKTFLLLAALTATFLTMTYIQKRYQFQIVDVPKFTHNPKDIPSDENDPNLKSEIPKSINLKVPFTPQAPTANWDELHNEACEEASSIMAHAYFSGRTDATLPADWVEEELTKITEWENKTFGYYLDIDSHETAQLLEDFYGLNTKILTNFTESDLKKELSENHLVLFPAAGRMLGNPNFRQPGPLYHMVVLRGYNQEGFYTNDPGTRKGLNYFYTFEILYKANGEWSHENHTVDITRKNVIVVWSR